MKVLANKLNFTKAVEMVKGTDLAMYRMAWIEEGFHPAQVALGFDEEEKFPTLDLNVVNLYTGEASFIKVGAVPSFIKRGRNIKKISSNMPPFGLVDELEIESQTIEVKSGDIIISVSDGVLEANKGSNEDSNWLIKFLATGVREPKQLAEDILNDKNIS